MEIQSSFMPRQRRAPSNAIAAKWHDLIGKIFDSYRPELHYMRGPGPKWRAKHQRRIEGIWP